MSALAFRVSGFRVSSLVVWSCMGFRFRSFGFMTSGRVCRWLRLFSFNLLDHWITGLSRDGEHLKDKACILQRPVSKPKMAWYLRLRVAACSVLSTHIKKDKKTQRKFQSRTHPSFGLELRLRFRTLELKPMTTKPGTL